MVQYNVKNNSIDVCEIFVYEITHILFMVTSAKCPASNSCLVEEGSCKLHSDQQNVHELFQSQPIDHIRDKEDHPIVL